MGRPWPGEEVGSWARAESTALRRKGNHNCNEPALHAGSDAVRDPAARALARLAAAFCSIGSLPKYKGAPRPDSGPASPTRRSQGPSASALRSRGRRRSARSKQQETAPAAPPQNQVRPEQSNGIRPGVTVSGLLACSSASPPPPRSVLHVSASRRPSQSAATLALLLAVHQRHVRGLAQRPSAMPPRGGASILVLGGTPPHLA